MAIPLLPGKGGVRSSETWRSILYGREVLKKGLIKINIWRDHWIPGLPSLKPSARWPSADAELVCDLFVHGTRMWNEEVVRDSFMALEAEETLKIKPSANLVEDVEAWAFEKNGVYSVRSAYRLLKNE
ncbi:hypothetical protein C2845_PM12G09240 [Panicum miliaceum]|uniref:Uncharacterized protein n=1 Tax=Panicum miliaceum TaxID=4540 RepID=A0A3L6QHD1_PANMI|nr:hypothetical protein C2845_PM12G09240 [Panicum miliaceum]